MERRGVSIEALEEALRRPRNRRLQVKEGKPDRMGIMGRNGVVVIHDPDTYIIITVFNYTKEYYKSRAKHKRNKTRRNLKKELNNRK